MNTYKDTLSAVSYLPGLVTGPNGSLVPTVHWSHIMEIRHKYGQTQTLTALLFQLLYPKIFKYNVFNNTNITQLAARNKAHDMTFCNNIHLHSVHQAVFKAKTNKCFSCMTILIATSTFTLAS